MKVKQIPIIPTYKRESGLWVLDLDKIKIPFDIKERSVVNIPPSQIGGNHKHPRQEAFIGIGDELELVWKQGDKTKSVKMNPEGELILFLIPPFLEHAVVNNSKVVNGILIEFADGAQRDVETCRVI